jgi:hypothetical protein
MAMCSDFECFYVVGSAFLMNTIQTLHQVAGHVGKKARIKMLHLDGVNTYPLEINSNATGC